VRFLLSLLVIPASAFALGSCGSDSTGDSCADGAVLEDDACVNLSSPQLSCSGKIVTEIPPGDCPEQTCSGPSAYAVCNGKDWVPCSCVIPPGYPLVLDAGFFGPEGGDGETTPEP
jgi:hypothetical protein